MIAASAHVPPALRVFASVSRAHLVAIATLGTFTFGWAFTGSYPWLVAAVCALDWFLQSVLNRVVDLPEDHTNGIVGADFVARHAAVVRAGALGVLCASFGIVHLAIPSITLLRVVFHGLGVVYNLPVLPGKTRLKQLYFLKNVASATAFLLTCFAYPLAASRGQLAPGVRLGTIAMTALFFFLFEISYEVICDLRDAPGDRGAGIASYPVVHGERAAVRMVDALSVASAVVLIFGFAVRLVPSRIAVMATAPVLQVFLYKHWLARGMTAEDCVRLAWLGVGLLVGYDVWVGLGLPGTGG